MATIRSDTLPNGLPLFRIGIPGTRAITVLTAFDAGALPPPEAPAPVPLTAGVQAYRDVNEGRSDKIVLTMGPLPP